MSENITAGTYSHCICWIDESQQFSKTHLLTHALRKCGRVVCNSCSPHRITIPYQYIVQVPVEGAVMGSCVSIPRPSVDAARAGSSREVATLGGGERVRLCNPCVPDPNIAPPQPSFHDPAQPYSSPNRQGRSASAASSSYAQSQRQPNNLETFHEALRNTARVPREPSILSSTGIQYGSYNDQNYRNRTQEPWDARSRSSTVRSFSIPLIGSQTWPFHLLTS